MRPVFAPTVLFALALAATARGQMPTTRTFVPKPGMLVRGECADIPALFAALPHSALGRMLEDADVAAAFTRALGRWRDAAARQDAVREAGRKLGILELRAQAAAIWRHVDPRDLERIEMLAYSPRGDMAIPATLTIVEPLPKGEGRMTRLFDDHVEAMRACADAKAGPKAEIDGVDVHCLARDEPDDPMDFRRPVPWFAHLPGTFLFGEGPVDGAGAMATTPKAPAAVTLDIDVNAYLEMLAGFLDLPAATASALGLDGITRMRWRLRFSGEQIVEDMELQSSTPVRGAFAALLQGKAKLPAQPLPAGGLAQVRLAVDLPALVEVAKQLGAGEDATFASVAEKVVAAFDGGVAFGIAAPHPGVVPRLFLSLGVADEAALDALLSQLDALGIERKQVERDDGAYTTLRVPGLPRLLQPSYCRRNGVLHLAETSISLRALQKILAEGGEAMDVGDVAVPDGEGDVLANFELRADPAAIYRAFHDQWLPLCVLAMADENLSSPPLLAPPEMPPTDVVARFVRPVRGVLRRNQHTLVLRQAGTLGGLASTALAMTWPPLLSGAQSYSWELEEVRQEIAREKLGKLATALETYKQANGHWPQSLGELFVAAKLDDDAFLLPGDAHAEDVALPADAGRTTTLKSSFRYFPTPVTVDTGNGAIKALLIAIEPAHYRRPVLADDGGQPDLWGEASTQPVDRFGK